MNKKQIILYSDIEVDRYCKSILGSIAFVPTMGALHNGHISLVKIAKKYADTVIVSLFVNPDQFTNTNDFSTYPKNIDQDIQKLEKEGVNAVFIPSIDSLYNTSINPEYIVEKEDIHLSSIFAKGEGAKRHGHFEGVYRVLFRFFGLINPDVTVFGQKDFQQTLLVKHLIDAHFKSIKLYTAPIYREESGLAMSSRNARLSPQQKIEAAEIFSALVKIQKAFSLGEFQSKILCTIAKKHLLQTNAFSFISIEIRNAKTFILKEKEVEKGDIILISADIAGVHLIDNWILG